MVGRPSPLLPNLTELVIAASSLPRGMSREHIVERMRVITDEMDCDLEDVVRGFEGEGLGGPATASGSGRGSGGGSRSSRRRFGRVDGVHRSKGAQQMIDEMDEEEEEEGED
jgi:hypothetical protein